MFDKITANVPRPPSITSPEASPTPQKTVDGRGLADPREGIFLSTFRYLMRTDVHTFAFSVAANAILSFFPFVLLLMTLIRRVFRSRVMYEVVVDLLRDYLPAGQEFVIRNLNALVEARNRAQVVSLIILLITSTGVFLPLEVALNRIWRFRNNRSYFGNQLISLGLAFACGSLALLSARIPVHDSDRDADSINRSVVTAHNQVAAVCRRLADGVYLSDRRTGNAAYFR